VADHASVAVWRWRALRARPAETREGGVVTEASSGHNFSASSIRAINKSPDAHY
jgi:hypothetical protein